MFVGTNCANPILMNDGWAYPATAIDGATVPLLTDASGNVYAAVRTYSDGREALALTFAQATYLEAVPPTRLRPGELGDPRAVHRRAPRLRRAAIDDLFLASDIFTGGTYRITTRTSRRWPIGRPARTQPLAAEPAVWPGRPTVMGRSRARRSADGEGGRAGPAFTWINHTWDHPILDKQSYADVLAEFTRNDTYLRGLGLTPYASVNAVTPNISGLASADAMRAIHDAGIRQIVGDTSIAGEDNPSPNVGRWNALQPSVLELPRMPTNIGYDTSQPAELIAEYEATSRTARLSTTRR